MTHLLDTNVCIVYLRSHGQGPIASHFLKAFPGSIVTAAIVNEELLFGAHRSRNAQQNLLAVRKFISGIPCLPFDDRAADQTAIIRADLERQGMRIGYNDFLIAGIALSNGLTLVTHNTGEFSRIQGLRLEDWEITP